MHEAILKRTITILEKGGVILYPTDTIWGVGCDARNEKAIQRILDIKQRPNTKGLILIDKDFERIKFYNPGLINDEFKRKVDQQKFPFSIIYPHFEGCADIVRSEDKSVALRVVKDKFCMTLIERLGFPIVSTSANLSTHPSPSELSEVVADIKNKVDFIVPLHINTKRTQSSSLYKINPQNGEWIKLR